MLKKVIGIVFSGLFVSLIVGLSAYAADNKFFPLKVGQEAVFNVRNNAGQTWQQTWKVSGMTVIPPTRIYYAIDILEDKPGKLRMSAGRSTTTALFGYHGFGREVISLQNGPVGTTWTWTADNGEIRVATIEAIETVTVPAGTYQGCLKVHKICTNCDEVTDWYEWVKPGFFLVKTVDYSEDDYAPLTYELKSYTP